MAYNHLETMDIYNLVSRWHAGYTISQISRTQKLDRKTIRAYIKLAEKIGVSRNHPLPEKAELLKLFQTFLPTNQRGSPVRNLLVPHKEEIVGLINDQTHPLKPKTAYEVICERHELKVSYGTFKRFLRTHTGELAKRNSTCRFETEPGEEVQIDYGKLGLLYDPLRQKKRTVYAFIATLSFSRLKFVDIVYRQDQRSFIASHLRMFDFFGGVPKRLVIDNLKSGVITPDLYAPQFNKAYQDVKTNSRRDTGLRQTVLGKPLLTAIQVKTNSRRDTGLRLYVPILNESTNKKRQNKLQALLDPKQRAEKMLLEALQRDYFEERQMSDALQKESGHIPYAHLRRKLLDIAAREQEHAELLAAKIRELGGEPSERAGNLHKARESKAFTSTLDLLQILQQERDDYIEYLEAAHLAKEAGHEDWTPLLTQIADEEQAHRRELMDVITRLNPLPVQRLA